MEEYNNLALYALNLIANSSYVINFVIIFTIVGFLSFFIWMCYDADDVGFLNSLLMGLIGAMLGGVIGFCLSALWSLIIFYILPFILLNYLIFRIKDIKDFISNQIQKYKNKSNNKMVQTISNDIKYEELAKQVYNGLKDDFPDIEYSKILENVKSKLN